MLCLATQSCPTLFNPTDPPGSSVHGHSPGKNTGVGCHALLQGGLPNPGTEPGLPALRADSLRTEPPGKPRESLRGGKIILITTKSKKHDRMFLNHLKPATFDT